MRDNKDPKTWLIDIVESVDLISLYLEGITEDAFFSSIEKQDSVIRRLGIIGEAVKILPQEFKDKHPKISWEQAAGDEKYFNP